MAPDPTVTQRPAPAEPVADDDGEQLVEEELLVEELSIDGMCGVY
ncbi:MAG: mycofactocin precursor [Acidimicrobiia bacterium]|jgi:mycofactocin precursor|nr:mycofactocin precursor [Acidimicrobiia bacterium]